MAPEGGETTAGVLAIVVRNGTSTDELVWRVPSPGTRTCRHVSLIVG